MGCIREGRDKWRELSHASCRDAYGGFSSFPLPHLHQTFSQVQLCCRFIGAQHQGVTVKVRGDGEIAAQGAGHGQAHEAVVLGGRRRVDLREKVARLGMVLESKVKVAEPDFEERLIRRKAKTLPQQGHRFIETAKLPKVIGEGQEGLGNDGTVRDYAIEGRQSLRFPSGAAQGATQQDPQFRVIIGLRGPPQGVDRGVGAALNQQRLPKNLRCEANVLTTRQDVCREALRLLGAARP